MIAKEDKPAGRRRRQSEPLDVSLTVRFNFGEQPEDAVTVINDRNVPMVGSVFANRDRILRGFIGLLLRTGLREPKVAKKVLGLRPWRRTR
jgi:hypothetical protein